MKIALFHQALGRFGGAERLALDLTHQLTRKGHEASLFWSGRLEGSVGDGVEIKRIPWGVAKLSGALMEMERAEAVLIVHHVEPLAGYMTEMWLKGKTPLLWYAGEPLRAIWEREITGTPPTSRMEEIRGASEEIYGGFVARMGANRFSFKLLTPLFQALDRAYVRGFDRVLANSYSTAEILGRIYHKPPDAFPVVYPGVNLDRFREPLKDRCEDSEGGRILAVGALQKAKNYPTLIRAVALASERLGRRLRLTVVGSGPQKGELMALARSLGEERVALELIPSASDGELARLYGRCDFLVHMAFWEPFGLAPLEAGVFGKPSIVTRVGGTAETVVEGETGLLANPYDVGEVAEKIGVMAGDAGLRAKMGGRARERVHGLFTIEKTTDRLVEVFEGSEGR